MDMFPIVSVISDNFCLSYFGDNIIIIEMCYFSIERVVHVFEDELFNYKEMTYLGFMSALYGVCLLKF